MANVSPAQVQQRLEGVDYPASKQDLINHAKKGGDSNKEITNLLNQLPDKDYHSPVDLNKEIGKIE